MSAASVEIDEFSSHVELGPQLPNEVSTCSLLLNSVTMENNHLIWYAKSPKDEEVCHVQLFNTCLFFFQLIEFVLDAPFNKFRLEYIEQTAACPEDAAVELLLEVFSDEALKCCSLRDSDTQPKLSNDGIQAILREYFFKLFLNKSME